MQPPSKRKSQTLNILSPQIIVPVLQHRSSENPILLELHNVVKNTGPEQARSVYAVCRGARGACCVFIRKTPAN